MLFFLLIFFCCLLVYLQTFIKSCILFIHFHFTCPPFIFIFSKTSPKSYTNYKKTNHSFFAQNEYCHLAEVHQLANYPDSNSFMYRQVISISMSCGFTFAEIVSCQFHMKVYLQYSGTGNRRFCWTVL